MGTASPRTTATVPTSVGNLQAQQMPHQLQNASSRGVSQNDLTQTQLHSNVGINGNQAVSIDTAAIEQGMHQMYLQPVEIFFRFSHF